MVRPPQCLNCLECCSFSVYQGRKFSSTELFDHFSFTEDLCELFFTKKDGLYTIGESCKQNVNGLCSVYHGELFPFSCAIYPFLLAYDKNNNLKIVIDRNCPHWRDIREDSAKVIETIIQYKKADRPVHTFKEKDLIRMGYRIITIQSDITAKETGYETI